MVKSPCFLVEPWFHGDPSASAIPTSPQLAFSNSGLTNTPCFAWRVKRLKSGEHRSSVKKWGVHSAKIWHERFWSVHSLYIYTCFILCIICIIYICIRMGPYILFLMPLLQGCIGKIGNSQLLTKLLTIHVGISSQPPMSSEWLSWLSFHRL